MNYIAAIFAMLCMQAGVSEAKTIIATIYANYPVSGSNIEEIKQSMLLNAMQDDHGNKFTAKTSPKFSWNYKFAENSNGCKIENTDIEVAITYQLPEIAGNVQLNDDDMQKWQKYAAATFKHEQGHAALSIETAKEIEWEATNMLPKASCGEAARTANMLIGNILNRHERNNLAYDTQTAHGVTQGAVFAQVR